MAARGSVKLSDHPIVADMLHEALNGEEVRPERIAAGSNRRLWWRCPNGPDHVWLASVKERVKGRGCPACNNLMASVTNSIATRLPQLVDRWHPTRNHPLSPAQVVSSTERKYWWKCQAGPDHEWEATPMAVSRLTSGCPFCGGRFTSVTNCLSTTHPELAEQWAPQLNPGLTPADVTRGSRKKVWWSCEASEDHVWEARVLDRAVSNSGCPFCSGRRPSSTTSLAAIFPDIAAEWHPESNGDLRPTDVTLGSNKKVTWQCAVSPDHVWRASIANRTGRESGCPCCAGRAPSVTNTLGHVHPELMDEWDTDRNRGIDPMTALIGSSQRVWWVCREDPSHSWATTIRQRAQRSTGCPMCSGRNVTPETNLAVRAPALARQWHPTKNELSPTDVSPGSNKLAWWWCPKGSDHVWEATVASRSTGVGCPFCRGLRPSSAHNLAALHPDLAAEWDREKNSEGPESVVPGSNKKVWWRCQQGPDHSWQAPPNNRTGNETGCPFCAGRLASVTNSVASLHPGLAAQWSDDNELGPEAVPAGSHMLVNWVCDAGPDHHWRAQVKSRTGGRGCPYCAGKRLSVSNSLATLWPEIASQWAEGLNGDVRPDQVLSGSGDRYWWLCALSADHIWDATVHQRSSQGTGCPFCRGLRVCASNSLAVLEPDIAQEWHPKRNEDLTPDQVTVGSAKRVWWRCSVDSKHVWQTSISHRTLSGSGCPDCAPPRHSKQETLLAYELLHFVPFDVDDHIVDAGKGRNWNVDFVLRARRVAIEFDGGWWHDSDRALSRDRRKLDDLTAAGWRVIRIREEPLLALGPLDVEVPLLDIHAAACATLRRLEDVLGLQIDGLDAYEAAGVPVATAKGRAHWRQLTGR